MPRYGADTFPLDRREGIYLFRLGFYRDLILASRRTLFPTSP
jgi:hypothetical protein